MSRKQAARKAEHSPKPTMDRTPTYGMIMQNLSESIRSGRIPDGTLLLEGPVAKIFGSSRSPVKQALLLLEADGLVHRFDGRGFLTGAGVIEKRAKIDATMLKSEPAGPKTLAWQTFYYDFEREISLLSMLGRFRVNEVALARHFSVGRTVARDLLLQSQRAGLVTKGDKSHWRIVPLDETRYRDLYELRYLLEPTAILRATDRIPPKILDAIIQRHRQAMAGFPDITTSSLDVFEKDLHINCVAYGGNSEIDEALKRTRCLLVTAKHLQTSLNRTPLIDPFIEEHLVILESMQTRRGDSAAAAMRDHLLGSGRKTLERFAAFRASRRDVVLPSYIIPIVPNGENSDGER